MAAMFADRAGKTRLVTVWRLLYRKIGINIDNFEKSENRCGGHINGMTDRTTDRNRRFPNYSSMSKISSSRPEKKSATRLNSSSSAISSKY